MAKELSKNELRTILRCAWSIGKRDVPCDFPEHCILGKGKDCKQAYQQILKLIERKVSKEFVEKWDNLLIPPDSNRGIKKQVELISKMLQGAGVEIEE